MKLMCHSIVPLCMYFLDSDCLSEKLTIGHEGVIFIDQLRKIVYVN